MWQGSAFDCPTENDDVALLHSRFPGNVSESKTCNSGAIVGQSLGIESNNMRYISQLNVIVGCDMIGKTIMCQYDNGSEILTVGSINLNLSGKIQSVTVTFMFDNYQQLYLNFYYHTESDAAQLNSSNVKLTYNVSTSDSKVYNDYLFMEPSKCFRVCCQIKPLQHPCIKLWQLPHYYQPHHCHLY